MKKISVFLILLCLTVFSVTAFALPLDRGDVDGSGKVTAADARLTLRFSAQLEEATDEQKAAADVDADGDVTAVDARIILRVAAEIDVFPALPETPTENGEENNAKPDEPTTVNPTTEPTTAEPTTAKEPVEPTEAQYPEELSVFLQGHYQMVSVFNDSFAEDMMNTVTTDGYSVLLETEMDGVGIGVLLPSDEDTVYLVNENRGTAVAINDVLLIAMGIGDLSMDDDFLEIRRDDLADPDPVVTQNPETGMTLYTLTYEDGSTVVVYVDREGHIKTVESYDKDAVLIQQMDVISISGDFDESVLSTSSYEMQSVPVFIGELFEDMDGLDYPIYDPDNIWDKEYYYDEYWSDGIDWYSVEAVTLSPEDELPVGLEQINSYRYMSGVAQMAEDPYTVEYEDGVTDEFYFLNYYEYCFRTDGESVRMDIVTEFDEELTWIVTKKTDLWGREKDVVYLVSPENGIYTEVNNTASGLPDMSESPYDFDLLAFTSPADFTEVTMKTATDEEGKEHVLLTYWYEDGSASEMLLVDGEVFRFSVLREDGTELEVIRFAEVSEEPVDEAVFSVKGLRKVLMTTFWITVNGVW